MRKKRKTQKHFNQGTFLNIENSLEYFIQCKKAEVLLRNICARKIQRQWHISISDSQYAICKKKTYERL